MSDHMCRAPGCVVATRYWLCYRHWREFRASRDELIAAWMVQDDARRAETMAAAKQRRHDFNRRPRGDKP